MAKLCFVGLLLSSLPQAFAAGRNFTVMFNEDTLRISSPTNLFASNILASAEIYWVKGPSGVLTLYAAPGIVTNHTEKASPVGADTLLVVDSEDGGALKMVQVGNLPGGGGGEANLGTTIGSGARFFAGKTGVTLQFVAATNTTGRMTIITNGNQMLFDVVEAGLDIANLGGTLASTDLSDTAALARITDLTTSSNALRTLFLASDITTSNALITLLNTKVDTNATSALGTNWITNVEDIGAPAAGDLIPIVDISTATRKHVTASQLVAAGGAGTVTHTGGALTLDQPILGAGGDDVKTSTIANFLSVLSVPNQLELGLIASNTVFVSLQSGSDLGTGKRDSPFLTISNAIRRASSWQTIHLGPGIYTGTTNGIVSSNKNLIIQGSGRESTFLIGSETYAGGFVRVHGANSSLIIQDVSIQGLVQDSMHNAGGTLVIRRAKMHANTQVIVTEGSAGTSNAVTRIYDSDIIANSDGVVGYGESFSSDTKLFNTWIYMGPTNLNSFAHALYTLDTQATIKMYGGGIVQMHTNLAVPFDEYYAGFNLGDGRIELHGVSMTYSNLPTMKHFGNSAGGTILLNNVVYDTTLVDGSVTTTNSPIDLDLTLQPYNAHLADLAFDGLLTGSKVGTGIAAGNITSGTLADARLSSSLQDYAGSTPHADGLALISVDTETQRAVLDVLTAAEIELIASNRVDVIGGTGGITVSSATVGGRQRFTVSDDDAGGGGTGFSTLTSGANTTASMTVGTGAQIVPTGSGTIRSTQWEGGAGGASATLSGLTANRAYSIPDEAGAIVLAAATQSLSAKTLVGPIIGSAGVSLTGDGDGAFTWLGLGNGSDENLIWNLDDTADTVTISSSTSLATANWSGIELQESGNAVPNATDTLAFFTATDSATFAGELNDEAGTSGGFVRAVGATLSGITISDAITFADNIRQIFNPGADAAGLNVGSIAGDPGTPSNGDLWYDSTANELSARINGATVALGAGGGGGDVTAASTFGTDNVLIKSDGTGKGVQATGISVDDSDNVTGVADLTATTATVTTFVFADSDGSPASVGQTRYDNTVTGLLDGALEWHDGTGVRYIVDLKALPSNDDYVVAYDADADGFYMKVDAGSGAAGTLTTIKENDVGVGGADIVTLDFLGADFDLAESPDTEVQVVIAAAVTRDTEWDTAAEINTATTDNDFVISGGALGTPSSGSLANATGLPISTGVSGLASGAATFLATPTLANLNTLVSDANIARTDAANTFGDDQTVNGQVLATQGGRFTGGVFGGNGSTLTNTATVLGTLNVTGTNNMGSAVLTNNIGFLVRTNLGFGGALTNFVINASSAESIVYVDAGTTNVHIPHIIGGSTTVAYRGTIILTNRTATPRTFSLGTSNTWLSLQQFDGISAPFTVTNSQAARFTYEMLGTNVQYAYKPMALPSN